jgi:uncharacterized protein involved in exopolysaccharide biosynthesis
METQNDEISLKELLEKTKQLYRYLLSQWKIILLAGILGASLGLTYSIVNKPLYIATLTFALEDDKQVSGLGSIASTFGIELGSSGGSAFSGSNLIELFKSRAIISQTLMRPIVSKNDTISLIEMYLQINRYRESWNNNPKLKGIQFPPLTKRKYFTRVHDSIMGNIYINLTKSKLTVGQQEDKGSLTAIEFKSENEEFAKAFCEALAEEVSQFYVDTKSKKARLNTAILQRQMDSIRIELNKSITEVAVGNDNTFMLNPALNIKRTPSTRRQIDVQSNTALLNELVKQTEIAKVTLRKETPLIQVVDRPILPLQKEKFGKAKGILLGGILAGFLTVLGLIIRKLIKTIVE